MNCGVLGGRVQHVLRRALNLSVFSNLKNVVALCGTNNLLLDSPKDIAYGILEIARSFKTNYSCLNVVFCGILSHDDSWSVNRVFIKEVNQILCYELSYTFVSYDNGWILSNGSLNADLYNSDRLHIVEKGSLSQKNGLYLSTKFVFLEPFPKIKLLKRFDFSF